MRILKFIINLIKKDEKWLILDECDYWKSLQLYNKSLKELKWE